MIGGAKVVYCVLAVATMAAPAFEVGPSPQDVRQRATGGRMVENALSILPFRVDVTVQTPASRLDTLYRRAVAGDVLITVLPDSVSAGRLTGIENLRVPTYSWRRGRAFFWQTAPAEAGVHVVQFLIRTTGEPDTLTLIIDLELRERAR